ncbi:MAG: hypothetical protein CL908_26520 [Deltaproteobacteria bacterium]|jgi:prepilin-type N-terminal cleavage/methylation domain-containing protein|nr:hypothetical protein [Deltaproteobacteria bacterium]
MTLRSHRHRRALAAAGAPARRTSGGFTLIEMMAVVFLIAMAMTLLAPQLSSSRHRALRNAAESIAASVEFARQRAVLSGIPHRVLIDLEEGRYRAEWLVTEERAFESAGGADDDGFAEAFFALDDEDGMLDSDGDEQIDLHPPERAERDYYPIPGQKLGSFSWLDEALYFVGIDGSSGWIEGGYVEIVFDADGTTQYALLEIADADDHYMTLEIEPLLDHVRRRNGRARS